MKHQLLSSQALPREMLKLPGKKELQESSFPPSYPLFYLLLHLLDLLQEPGVVPLLLQADALGLLAPAQGVVLLHPLDLLLLLPLQVLQFRVIELLLCLAGEATKQTGQPQPPLCSTAFQKLKRKREKRKKEGRGLFLLGLSLFTEEGNFQPTPHKVRSSVLQQCPCAMEREDL